MSVQKLKRSDPSSQAYAAALDRAFDELGSAKSDVERLRRDLHNADMRVSEIEHAIQGFLKLLPQDQADFYSAKLAEQCEGRERRSQGQASARTGDVHDNVVALFENRGGKWTASEIRKKLQDSGSEADPKAVYNVLDYLVRSGRIKRHGRGQYLIPDLGVGVELNHDFGEGSGIE